MDNFDFNREYGIVLEGGGAKGAYQIGVWKALMEFGVKIKAIAGVSIGALNGALICMGDYEKAVNIWKNISYSSIMNVDDAEMDKLMGRRFRDINIQTVTKQGSKFLVGGGIDITPLRQLLDENVDEQKIKESEIDLIMGTFNVGKMKEEEISVKEAQDGSLKDYLLASASFPLFKNDKLLGKTYLDGGVANNVPIDMLIKRGYKDIIVVRIFGPGLEKRIKIPEDVNVTYIAPKCHLCNVLEFNNKKAIRNISMGYYDAVRILKPLAGIEYYIDSSKTEKEYMDTLLNLTQEQMKELIQVDKTEDKRNSSLLRRYAEEIYPQMAVQFKLNKNWRYDELYYTILEYCAKKVRMKKFRIYTEQEFCQILLSQLTDEYEEDGKPDVIVNLAKALVQNNFA